MKQQMETTGWCGDPQRGASMGRRSRGEPTSKCHLFEVILDSGGYDDGNAYWGLGQPLFCLTDDDEFVKYERFVDSDDALKCFKNRFPDVEITLDPRRDDPDFEFGDEIEEQDED